MAEYTEEHTILLEARDLAELAGRGVTSRKERAMWIVAILDNALRPDGES